MDEFPLFDDVGSFPLPEHIDRDVFNQFYWIAYYGIVKKTDIFENRGIYNNFIRIFLQSLQFKLDAGVEIINYPQHMDMNEQFLKPINDFEAEPDLIESDKAFIPEMIIIKKYAKEYYERLGTPLNIKICITGPIELYLKKHNFTIYKDLALNLAKSINLFLQNSIINNKYMKTKVVALDEPSFGYVRLFNVSNDDIIRILDKALEGIKGDNQIHLHSLKQAYIPLQSRNINILTCEYASDKSNTIPKRELEKYDKFIRVGITRTDINSIISEHIDSGKTYNELKTYKGAANLIDSIKNIKKNLYEALKLYGDRLIYIGPDCGLSGWSPPKLAYKLLRRTYKAIREVKKELKIE
ncbi:MAG: hypothetical protein ACTSQJ_05395 [Promethearchaeota archaeon]